MKAFGKTTTEHDVAATETEASGAVDLRVSRAPGDAPAVRVRDGDGALLFEYDAATGRAVLYAPRGDLELRAPRGSVRVEAAGDVSLRAGAEVRVAARALRGAVAEATLAASRVELAAVELLSRVGRARQQYDHWRVRARKVVEEAGTSMRSASELAQWSAGRLRVAVDGAAHVAAQEVHLKGRDAVKVKGEKIHLA